MYGPFDADEGHRMLDRLTHRGPDGEGDRTVGAAWLGHRLLAIVDLESGAQPIGDAERGVWIVGDGEVYNHAGLRERLEQAGHTFATDSDHEPALVVLDTEGAAGLTELWGVFAFAFAAEDGRFLAARDTLGVVPLYWVRDGDTTLFASELKAFDPHRRGDVELFPPGHYWTPTEGLRRFATLPVRRSPGVADLVAGAENAPEPPERVLTALRDALCTAVERCMVADVPVGALVSGGLDSSIITTVAAHIAEREGWRLKTFAVGMEGSDDLVAARTLARELGTAHYERIYTADELIDWVPEVIGVIESFDPQLVHSSVPNLLVSKLAARDVKVVLIGEGADELFAGYAHHDAITSDAELHEALVATIEGLHHLGLQRVDRIAGDNALEPRIPFLDFDVVELGLGLPAQWKLTTEERPEKWLLRKAFEGVVPDELLWRTKAQFGQGTGAEEVLRDYYAARVTDEELEAERDVVDPPLRSREELAYYRIFQRHLTGLSPDGVIGRFVEP